MKKLTIWFKEDALDYASNGTGELCVDCIDVIVQQGFLVAFLPEDKFGNRVTNAYNIGCIDSWQFVQNAADEKGDKKKDEGVSEE